MFHIKGYEKIEEYQQECFYYHHAFVSKEDRESIYCSEKPFVILIFERYYASLFDYYLCWYHHKDKMQWYKSKPKVSNVQFLVGSEIINCYLMLPSCASCFQLISFWFNTNVP